jgi:FkbM family methyltransferase
MNRHVRNVTARPLPVTHANCQRIPREAVVRGINPHLLNLLKVETEHETELLPASRLLSPARFDVMAKVIYAKHRAMGGGMSWATRIYREHLRILSGFEEGDGLGKTCFEDYRFSFDKLLDSLGSGGFNPEISMLPVGNDFQIIDGAHRLGAALFYDEPVRVVYFDVQPGRYDYRYFRERGLPEEISAAMALEYCRLSPDIKVAVLFPVAQQYREKVMSLLGSDMIAYEKTVTVTHSGRANFIRLLYAGERWVGDGQRETRGIRDHVENRFEDGRPVTLLFFEHDDPKQLRQIKEEIRELAGLGNYSIHISDSSEETRRVAEVVFNEGGMHWLNHSRAGTTREFDRCFCEYRERLPADPLVREKFCVDGSGVLAAYGIRDVNDLDYLCLPGVALEPGQEDISCHNEESRYYNAPIEDIITDPGLHFTYEGLKFISLEQLRHMKTSRNEPKDRLDVQRINALSQGAGLLYSPSIVWSRWREFMLSYRYRAVRWLRRHLPGWLLPLARLVYQIPSRIAETSGPGKRKMIYRGFVLHYSRGTSLVHGISKGEVYEPAITSRIVQELVTSAGKAFLDIGANVGLISLNVIHEVPEVAIYAFEPGEHQACLLEATVTENGLQNQINIIRKALGTEAGEAEFIVHRSQHASGDGFKDTGRAGKSHKVMVPVTTLDEWWHSAGEPQIDVAKLDTEGAELLILQGAGHFLSSCRPVLVMEIDRRNLEAYPYDAAAMVSWLNEAGYRVETIDGIIATLDNMAQLQTACSDYVATPGVSA